MKETPFWQEWWFIPTLFLYILIVVSVGVYLILQYRFRQKLKTQRIRNQLSSDLHDDVGSTMSSIAFLSEAALMRIRQTHNAEETLEEIAPLLEEILANTQDSIESMRGIVMAIHPSNDDAGAFFGKLRVFAERFLETRHVKCDFAAPHDLHWYFTPEQRRNLFLFLKEALHNVLKHAQATVVRVEVSRSRESLSVLIQDNGCGFDPHQVANAGHGLKSLQSRADELHAAFSVKSAPGDGTLLRLHITHTPSTGS
jgi:signal transduction histidine kinase